MKKFRSYRLLCGIILVVIFGVWMIFLDTHETTGFTSDKDEIKTADADIGQKVAAAPETADDGLTSIGEQSDNPSTDDINSAEAVLDDTDASAAQDVSDASSDSTGNTPKGQNTSALPSTEATDTETDTTEQSDADPNEQTDASDAASESGSANTVEPLGNVEEYLSTEEENPVEEREPFVLTEVSADERPEFKFCIAAVDNYVNVRSGPSTDYKIIGRVYSNGYATVIERLGEWTKVSYGDKSGYVSSQYLLYGNDAIKRAKNLGALKIKVFSDVLNVRSEPTTESSKIMRLTTGDRYDFLPEYSTKAWYAIKVDSDTVGFVSSDYCDITLALDPIQFYD